MNRLHSGGPLAVGAAAGGRGGASRRSGKGRAGGRRSPLGPPSQTRQLRPQHLPGRPRPIQSFVSNREPRSRPRVLPRPQTPLHPARARNRDCGFGSVARPALPVLTPAGPGPGRWRPSRTHKLGGGEPREPPPPPPHPRAHLSCQGPAALPRLTHAGATVARVCLNCLSHPGLRGGGSAARGGGASGAWAKKHLLLSPPRTHPSATPPTPRPRLAPGALTSAGGRCRVSAASARARTDGPPGAPSAVTARRVGAAPALLATPAGLSGDLRGLRGHSSPRVGRSGLQHACHIRASQPPPQAPGTVPGTWPPTKRGEG